MDLTSTLLNEINFPNFTIEDLEANSQFKAYADKYLAFELLTVFKDGKKATVNSLLNKNDIELFFKHYRDHKEEKREISMKSSFNGEGGILLIDATFKPLNSIWTSIAKAAMKLLIYVIIIVGLISLAIEFDIIGLLILGGFFLGLAVIGAIADEIRSIKNSLIEIKRYGR